MLRVWFRGAHGSLAIIETYRQRLVAVAYGTYLSAAFHHLRHYVFQNFGRMDHPRAFHLWRIALPRVTRCAWTHVLRAVARVATDAPLRFWHIPIIWWRVLWAFPALARDLHHVSFPILQRTRPKSEVCAICLNEDDETEATDASGEWVQLPDCAHSFHINCLGPWALRAAEPKCPCCRTPL